MYKNKALIDRTLNMPSINDNNVMTYHKLVSLIEQYNMMARDKGLPTKKVPVYNNSINYSLTIQSVASILKDIDRVKRIKEEDDNLPIEEKTARGVEFTIEIVTDFPDKPAWKDDEGLWYYIQDGDNICVYADTDAIINRMNGGTTLDLGYADMPYELLVDKDGKEWEVNSYYTETKGFGGSQYGLFGYHYQNDNWNTNVIGKLTSLTIDNWTNKNVKDMRYMFSECEKLESLTLGDNFNTSRVTEMIAMFDDCSALTTLTLGDNFNTSKVTSMTIMFKGCSSLTTLTLGDNFDTSNVTSMATMFYGCKNLTSLTLSDNFDTSNVTNMQSMFQSCSSLTSLTLGDNFNTSKVMNMYGIFDGCSVLTTLTLSDNFNTSNVTNMSRMFSGCSALTTLTLSDNFNTSNVTSMNEMFSGCRDLESISLYQSAESIISYLPLGTWGINDTYNTVVAYESDGTDPTWNPPELPDSWGDEQWTLKRMDKTKRGVTFDEGVFTDGIWTYSIIPDTDTIKVAINRDTFFTQFNEDIATLGYSEMPYEKLIDTENKTYQTISYNDMFDALGSPSSNISTVIIDNWTNMNVRDMSNLFNASTYLSITLGDKFDTSNVTDMSYMFNDCTSITLGDNFNTSNVTSMNEMFSRCSALTKLTLGDNFDTSKVIDMSDMFSGCSSLTTLTLGDNFDTSSVEDMQYMFSGCSSLTTLTLGDNFDTSSVEDMRYMFQSCSSLTSLTLGDNFDTSNVTDMSNMFAFTNKLATIELYKSAKSIIDQLPSGTWNINGTDNTVTSAQNSSATWNPPELPNSWGDEQWTLTRTIQQTS